METQITNLRDLFIEQLRKLYNAEKQLCNALPEMKEKASSRELKLAIKNHTEETDRHIKRLDAIFKELEVTSVGERSEITQMLIKEAYELMNRCADSEILDAALIAAIQAIEHFEIAGYGTVRAFADELGYSNIADQLALTMDEEKRTDHRLTEIATNDEVNAKAKSPVIA